MKLRIFSPATGELACNFVDSKRELSAGAAPRRATLHRMVLPDHICPFGLRAKRMLEEHGFAVDDRILASRDEVEAFKSENGIASTPLVFIDGERIGGSDELARFLESQPVTPLPTQT